MERPHPYPPSSLKFDWVMAVLSVVLMGGVIQDGWAHSHGLVDQSFFTPWHAILYVVMALNGVVLAVIAIRNLLRGFPLRYALPIGYWSSLIGVAVFAIGGLFDLYWHTRYGIETDINALISPSHLWLAFGGALIFSGPLQSIASRYDPQTGGWRITGPAILSSVAILALLGFFTQYAQPMGVADEAQIVGKHQAQSGGALYAVKTNGKSEIRILSMPGRDIWGATASIDGERIAFRMARQNDPQSDIYVVDADGNHLRRLTHSGRHDTQPAWSPDGTRIAFVSIPAATSGSFMLQTIRSDGSQLRTIVNQESGLQFPAWSPDGKSLAYQTRNGLRPQIAVIQTSGGTPQFIAATAGGSQPAWSSLGQIAFVNGDGDIAMTGIHGVQSRVIARGGQSAAQLPAWSADGRRVAYIKEDASDAQVFVTDLRTGASSNVSQLPGLEASRPAWLGDAIAFTAAGRTQPATSFIGLAFSEDANLVESIIVAGVALLLIRRWRMPFGAMTVLITLFAIAMIFQSDEFFAIVPSIVTGLLADVAILILGERTREGAGFYAFGFATPAVLFGGYLIAAGVAGSGLGWPPNMIAGSPIIAGFAGLLIAFCFAPPLSVRAEKLG